MSDTISTVPTLEGLRERRDEIIRLAERYGASNVRVFGSVARGDGMTTSDVDLLVDFRPGSSLFDLSGLWQDLRDLLGCDVDVVSDHAGMRESLRAEIERDAVAL